jgi:hypothetical protein
MRTKNPRAKFKVGGRVRFGWPTQRVWGTMMEDRGPLGVDGRRQYVVGIPVHPFETERHAVSEDRLELDVTPPAPLEQVEILDFLENGGLIKLLLTKPSLDGPKDPHVWLCRSQPGNVTHTFAPERGQVGGAAVPFAAFRDSSPIRAGKRDEVATYLRTFGLTPEEPEEVIRAVGVGPVKKPRRRRKAETAWASPRGHQRWT